MVRPTDRIADCATLANMALRDSWKSDDNVRDVPYERRSMNGIAGTPPASVVVVRLCISASGRNETSTAADDAAAAVVDESVII